MLYIKDWLNTKRHRKVKIGLGVVVHDYNPSIQEEKGNGLIVPGQPELHNKTPKIQTTTTK
jgi:hypothetical protein